MPVEAPEHAAWTHTARGRALDLVSPSANDVDLVEVAWGLARLCRYAGGIRAGLFYSVAEHSAILSAHALATTGDRAFALRLLLHDAAEAYVGDMTRPVQVALGLDDGPGRARYAAMVRGVEEAILRAIRHDARHVPVGFDATPEDLHTSRVKRWDLRVLLDERAALLEPGPAWAIDSYLRPLGVTLRCWRPERAAVSWAGILSDLAPGCIEAVDVARRGREGVELHRASGGWGPR